MTLRNVPGAISATSDRQDDLTFAADVRGGTPMITTDAPAWLRRSDQAVTWGPHHAHRPPGVMKKVTGAAAVAPEACGIVAGAGFVASNGVRGARGAFAANHCW